MADIDWYQDEWEKDGRIRGDQLASEALHCPELHGKWYKFYVHEKLLLLQRQSEVRKFRLQLSRYFNMELDKPALDEMDREQCQRKIYKTEMDVWVDADDEYNQKILLVSYSEEIVEFLKSILNSINWRRNMIQTALDAMKFEHGLNA